MEEERTSQDLENLRKRAEDRVSHSDSADTLEMSDVDVRALLHELQVHQIELEVQNEELLRAKSEAEDALRKYSDLYDFAPVGYLTIDEKGGIIEANLAAASMFGIPRSRLMGLPFRNLIAPRSRPVYDRFCASAMESDGRTSRELEFVKNRKETFYALTEGIIEYDRCPSPSRITITDITRRKEAEEALHKAYSELEQKVQERTAELAVARSEAERRAAEMESFMASLADGVVLFDLKGNVTFINDAGMDMLGVPGGETFENWLDRCEVYDLEGQPVDIEDQVVYRALNGEAVNDERGVFVTPWGKEMTISMSSSPVLGGEGQVIGATMLFRDQSERVTFEKERQALLDRERHIAEILEQAVIPVRVKSVPGVKAAVRYVPAYAEAGIGGDFYDIFELDDCKVGVLIGDVAGKGLASAVGIAAVRYSIRSYAYLDPRPSRVLTLANTALCRSGVGEQELGMLTAFFAIIDTRFGGISYATGGHEPALLKTANGSVERLEARGPLMGVIGDFEYVERSRKLLPGDTVVMVTDGITEARPDPVSLFGIEGVERYLAESSEKNLDAIAEGILQAARGHAGGAFSDDAAIVVVSLENG